MCEANVYMEQNGKEELLLASVDVIEPQADGALRMVNIFGEQKISGAFLIWLNRDNHSYTIAHPEPDRCDDDRYNTAFTLQVR